MSNNPYTRLFEKALKKNPFDNSLILPYLYKLNGRIDKKKLYSTLAKCLNLIKHPGYENFGDQKDQFLIQYIDLSSEKTHSEDIVWNIISAPFVKISSKLARFVLAKINRKEYLFGFSFSHLIFDGVSLQFFINQLEATYNLKEVSPGLNLVKKLELNYSDSESVDFWKSQFERERWGSRPPFFLPAKKSDSEDLTSSFRSLKIDGKIYDDIVNFLQKNKTTLFRFLTSTHAALLAKYFVSQDENVVKLCFGHTASCRDNQEEIGCFTNIAVLPLSMNLIWSPLECLKHVEQVRRKVKPFQKLPFLELIKNVPEVVRDEEGFDFFINESPGIICPPKIFFNGIKSELLKRPDIGSRHSFSLYFGKQDSKIEIVFGYNQNKLTEKWVQDYIYNFSSFIKYFVHHSNLPINQWKFPPSKDQNLGDTRVSLEKGFNFEKELNEVIERYKEKKAIKYNDEVISYEELGRRISIIKNQIQSHSISTQEDQTIFGVLMDRSENIIVTILSILSSGHIFLPLDPTMPVKRIELFLEESECKYLVVNTETLNNHQNFSEDFSSKEIINIDEAKHNQNVERKKSIDDPLAYLFFTSGSTGTPKGVQVSMQNLLYSLSQIKNLIGFSEGKTFFASTSINFDISLVEILLPLLNGGNIFLVDRATALSSHLLQETLNKNHIDFLQATPSTWRMLKEINWKPKSQMTLLTGGEPLNEPIAEYLLSCSENIYNLYGPTETTIWSSIYRLRKNQPISLGNPFPGTRFYVRSKSGELCSMGQPGELCISGYGVSRGYLNGDPNAAFMQGDEVIPERYYRTGDLVNHLGDGLYIFMGRINDDVKVRGHRISLREVRNFIQTTVKATHVEVIVYENPEDHLVAFLTPDTNKNEEELKKEMRLHFPEYMIPSVFYVLDVFPTTLSGKVDRDGLRSLYKNRLQNFEKNSHSRTSSLERILKKLKDVIFDNFGFYIQSNNDPISHYGFQSIAINQLALLIENEFGKKIEPHLFFEFDTLEKLSNLIVGNSEKNLNIKDFTKKSFNKFDIAIVGMSGLFPNSQNVDEFWKNLISNTDFITQSSRPYLNEKLKAGFIQNPHTFDASFFNISPLESEVVDPQQRLMLQNAWHAIEDSGYDPLSFSGKKVGVYVTSTSSDYWLIENKNKAKLLPYSIAGFSNTMLANRLSYFFNWKGPSIHIETACSGSLSALSKACDDLEKGKCDWALVGASNLILSQEYHDALRKSHFLSSSSRCATLDTLADGYVRGEGIVCLFLQRASEVDLVSTPYYTKIVSIAENHSGKAHSLTAPKESAQKELILDAYDEDLVNRLEYYELHGTGTKLGDPIEIDALKGAWAEIGRSRPPEKKVYLGSVKSQIGHLESAAGLSSIVKVVLSLKNNTILKMNHFTTLNPHISMDDTPFVIPQKSIKWESSEEKRVAGISSFGFGGSNVHVVLEEGTQPLIKEDRDFHLPEIFCISAKHPWSLRKKIEDLINYLQKDSDNMIPLSVYAQTLNMRRSHFAYRVAFLAASVEELINYLSRYLQKKVQIKPIVDNLGSYQFKKDIFENRISFFKEILNAYLQGFDIQWNNIYKTKTRVLENFPKYPFHQMPFWFEHLELKNPISFENQYPEISIICKTEKIFEIEIPKTHPWLREHIVQEQSILPGVAFLELVYSSLKNLNKDLKVNVFKEIHWLRPITCKENKVPIVVTFDHIEPSNYTVQVENEICGRGMITNERLIPQKYQDFNFGELQKEYKKEDIYPYFSSVGIDYGEFFKKIENLKVYALGTSSVINIEHSSDQLMTNLLDCALQSTLGLNLTSKPEPLLPFAIGKMHFYDPFFSLEFNKFSVLCRKKSSFRVDISIYEKNSNLLLIDLIDVCVRPINHMLLVREKEKYDSKTIA